ncbi:MAG: IPT/TIG domain-containing protein [Acidobacteria bacterium]|nr:IPT/TIG domain-containing protein [Acidobacteriota bacterium]
MSWKLRHVKIILLVMVLGFLSVGGWAVSAWVRQQTGGTTRFVYDEKSQLRAVIAPNGDVAIYEYDPAGNITAIRRGSAAQPVILSFFAKEGIAGDKVTFVGTGFGPTVAENLVMFKDGKTAVIESASVTEIVAIVPEGTVTGEVTIQTPTQTLTTSEPFVIVPPVQVTPLPVVIDFREQVNFTARVRVQSSDRSVTWSVTTGTGSGNGTITQNGVYNAPRLFTDAISSVPIVVRATSKAFPTLFTEVPVTVGRVRVTPSEAILLPTEQLQLTASVFAVALPANNRKVTWLVNGILGGNPTVGTISAEGLYQAPALIPAEPVVIRAMSQTLPQLFAEARIRIGQIQVVPAELTVGPGASGQFTATLPGTIAEQPIIWSINGVEGGNEAIGTITDAGVYTAPNAVVTQLITVRAASRLAPNLFGEARVRMGTISVSTSQPFVELGGGSFSALCTANIEVGPEINRDVEWSINGVVEGNNSLGTIIPVPNRNFVAHYDPPDRLPPVPIVIRATLKAQPSIFGEAGITLGKMTLSPTAAVLGPGLKQKFTSVVTLLSDNKQVVWSVNQRVGGSSSTGLINTDGTYTAPNQPSTARVQITATSLAVPRLTKTADVTLVGSIQVSPASASLVTEQTAQFNAVVLPQGTVDQVTWSVNGAPGGNATVGTISGSGFYTAPATVPTGAITIRATSTAVPSVFGEARVTVTGITNIQVFVSPSNATVTAGDSFQFNVQVLPGNANQQVTWSVDGIPGGNSNVGTISPTGLYTAPTTVPSGGLSVTVRATSVAQPTAFSDATVIVPDTGS